MPDRSQTIREAEHSTCHDLVCNCDRVRQPRGVLGCSCNGRVNRLEAELEAAESTVRALRESFETLVSACENDFISPATDDCLDDEGVAFGTCAVTFGMIRKARALLLASPQSQEGKQ